MRLRRTTSLQILRVIKHGINTQRTRPYSQAVLQTPGNEVKTKIRNGLGPPIDILITYPPRPEHDSPIILALGQGTRQREQDKHAHTQALSWSTNATIVRPIYDINRHWAYPSPVHMTLRVLDWISQNLRRPDLNTERGRIGVCGGGVCGSLATMLALTECNPMRSCVVRAAAISNPILDWTDVFPQDGDMVPEDLQSTNLDSLHSPHSLSHSGSWDASADNLLALRKEIFRQAQDFFDPFASPLLFFRTPHFSLPYSYYANVSAAWQKENEVTTISRKRTYHRVYPPSRSELVLPKMRITVDKNFGLAHQATELVHFMRRSLMRDKEQSQRLSENELEERFVACEVATHQNWDKQYVTEMGQWLGEALRKA